MKELPFEECWWLSTPSAEDEYLASLEEEDPLDCLTERQRFVVELRFGLRDEVCYTQQEVAELMGVSRQAVSKIERAAKKKLDKRLHRTVAESQVNGPPKND